MVNEAEVREVLYEKVYASLGPPPKISLKHDWMNKWCSEVAQRPDGQIVEQFKFPIEPNPNPDHDSTEKPVVGCDPRIAPGGRRTSRSQEIETRSVHEEAVTVTPVVGRDASHEPTNDQSMLNEVNIDF